MKSHYTLNESHKKYFGQKQKQKTTPTPQALDHPLNMTALNLIVDFPSCQAQEDLTPQRYPPTATATAARRRHSFPMRRVSFDEEIALTYVEDLTTQYKSDLWFNRQEMKHFKAHTIFELRRLKASNPDPSSYFTLVEQEDDTTHFLGLESCMTETIHLEISYRKKALRRAIMFEQDRQRINGISDPDLIANISEVESDWARRRASLIAMLHDS